MPLKKRSPKKRNQITTEAVAAFAAGDYLGLHRALGLKPWDASPLDNLTDSHDGTGWASSLPKARDLRRRPQDIATEKGFYE